MTNENERTALVGRQNDGRAAAGAADSNDEEEQHRRVRKSILFKVFAAFSGLASVVSLLMLLAQIASFALFDKPNFIEGVLRVYVTAFCIFFVLSELQCNWFLSRTPAFASWFHRGFLYTLIGVIGMEQAFATIGKAYPDVPAPLMVAFESLLLRICSVTMFGIGVVYMLMGVLCLKGVWEEMQVKYRIRLEEEEHRSTAAEG